MMIRALLFLATLASLAPSSGCSEHEARAGGFPWMRRAAASANAVLLQGGAFLVPFAGDGFAPRDVTLAQPLTAGSEVVVCFKGEDPGNIPTITDLPGASNTYVSMDHQGPNPGFETDIFVGTVNTGGQTKIRVTRPAAWWNDSAVGIAEFAGVTMTDGVADSFDPTWGTTLTAGAITPTAQGGVVVGCVSDSNDNSVYTIQGAGYTDGGHVTELSIGYYFHSAAGVARNVTYSASGGSYRQGEAVGLK